MGCGPRSGSCPAPAGRSAGPRGRRIGGSIEHTAPLPRGLVRRAARGPGGQPARAQRGAARGRADPRAPGRRRAARAPRRARERQGGASGRGSASRSRTRGRPRSCARRSGCRSATGCSCGRWSTARPAAAAGLRARRPADGGRRAAADVASTTCSTRSGRGRAGARRCVRGTEEREPVVVHFSS